MSTSLANTVAMVNDPVFQNKVRAAMTEKALNIAGGDPGGPASAVLRALRNSLAMAILSDAGARLDPFLRLVANDNTISGVADPTTVTDAQIRGVVDSMWEAVAVATRNMQA